jgi:hypothetical protein
MKKLPVFLTVIVLLLSTNLLLADEYTYPGENPVFSITFPDDWKVETDEELLHATPNDETLYLGLWALADAENIDAALDEIDDIVAEFVDDIETDEPDVMEINGIEITFIDGVGVDEEGEQVEASVALFSPDEKTVFVLFYFGYPETTEQHEKALVKILESIKAK